VTLGGTSTLRLALNSVTVAALRTTVGEGNSRTYTVIDSGATNVNNLFTTTDFTTAGFSASEWQVLYNQGGGNVQLVFTPVPEPASMLAVAAAGLGVFEWRRRRRKAAQATAATVTA
jgi:PEP-CTERM motif